MMAVGARRAWSWLPEVVHHALMSGIRHTDTNIAHLRGVADVYARPSAARSSRIGTLGAETDRYRRITDVPLIRVSEDGRWGKVRMPWRPGARTGWIQLTAHQLVRSRTRIIVHRRSRMLDVMAGARLLARVRAGVGAMNTPTPLGSYWITRIVDVPAGQRGAYGGVACALSGIQSRLPDGWRGGNQLAIHGTGAPASIGQAASAGCVRLSEHDLRMLRRVARAGTTVDIVDS